MTCQPPVLTASVRRRVCSRMRRDTSSCHTARFADHQDTEEEVAVGARAPDRRVVYTVVIALSDGGDTAMRILGRDELAFTGEAGSGVAFRSALWHRTEHAGAGVWKLAVFYGYLL